jgi:hypothetical protein
MNPPLSYTIEVNPPLTPDQLFDFYQRNTICEVGFGKETAARILTHPHLIVAAFQNAQLIALARATFDGLSAHIMEFSLDLRFQPRTQHKNGSLLESDDQNIARAVGQQLLHQLTQMGCTFITGYIVENCEEPFYESLGFRKNTGHTAVYIDKRPYVDPPR